MTMKIPLIDEKRYEDIYQELKSRIPTYTPEWQPAEGDGGLALIKIVSHMLFDIKKRLQRLPLNNFLTFLNMIGITLIPPKPARVPVTFTLAQGTKEHVLVPAHTKAASGEIIFETEKTILLTPAALTAVYAVDPATDTIVENKTGFTGDTPPSPYTWFESGNSQEHVLYLGHAEIFDTADPLDFELSSDFTQFREVTWEYYGEKIETEDGAEVTRTGWHPLIFTDTLGRILIKDGNLQLRKASMGEIVEYDVQGITNRWIRCRAHTFTDDQIINKALIIKRTPGIPQNGAGFVPDLLFTNNMPIDFSEKPFYPFGEKTHQASTFYIGCRDVLSHSTAGITLDIELEVPGTPTGDKTVKIAWEYWNGKRWDILKGIDDTYKFDTDTTLTFMCPADIRSTKVNNEDNYWIRARLASGDFEDSFKPAEKTKEVTIVTDPTPDTPNSGDEVSKTIQFTYTDIETVTGRAPQIKTIHLAYEYTGSGISPDTLEYYKPEAVQTVNNLMSRDYSADNPVQLIKPFTHQDDTDQTIYLGFNKRLFKGPVSILFSVEEIILNREDHPEIDWYYSTTAGDWKRLLVSDNTTNLSSTGTVEFYMPEDMGILTKFNHQQYWIKGVDRAGKLKGLPALKGIYPNTVFALQAESIRGEVLGAGNGSAGQKLSFFKDSIISEDVWINEASLITENDLDTLKQELSSDALDIVTDDSGKIKEIWVKWCETDDLYFSLPTSRHYLIDRINGEISFGDGNNGMMPPAGRDNIKASYMIGGGVRGNLAAREITELKTTIAYVDSVTNYLPAGGGANVERLEEAQARGPYHLKHRNRAVSLEDFEKLAALSSGSIARVRCVIQGKKLKVIVIPKENTPQPVPTFVLLDTVGRYLAERMPVTIPAGNIEVVRPVYKGIDIEAVVVPVFIDIAVTLEKEVIKRINAYLHPLTGGLDGTGWDFGRNVFLSDVYAFLESIEGVDYIERLTINAQTDTIEVGALETVCSGYHKITMSMGE